MVPPRRRTRPVPRSSGHLPAHLYHRLQNAAPQQLEHADNALTETVNSWDGVPSLAHYTALEALILIRMRRRDFVLCPIQPSLFDVKAETERNECNT